MLLPYSTSSTQPKHTQPHSQQPQSHSHSQHQPVVVKVKSANKESVNSKKVVAVSHWELARIRQYINYIKHHIQPRMTIEAQQLLVTKIYYSIYTR